MFRPADVIIDAFVQRLIDDYRQAFFDGSRLNSRTITEVARMALARISMSNAPYHDLSHTMLVTLAGQDILRGRLVRDGNVSSDDWTQFVASCLCFAIGFCRDICPGDNGRRLVINENGDTDEVPRGMTDGYIWKYFTDRGKIFVRHYFHRHPVLDEEQMAANIEYSRWPPPQDRNFETDTFPGLLRAAHIIGAIGDPNFMLKIKPLMVELEESGTTADLGFSSVAAFIGQYPEMFWNMLHPRIADGMAMLRYTGNGRIWLANLHRHVLLEERKPGEQGA